MGDAERSGEPGVREAEWRSRGLADARLRTPSELLGELQRVPGGAELLALAPAGSWLVGGAVRDLLLGRAPRELDVVLAGEGASFGEGTLFGEDAQFGEGASFGGGTSFGDTVAALAGELAVRLGVAAGSSGHERFGTASVVWDAGRIDVAAARRERYAAPGALPAVEGAPLAEDLRRRDLTVNALAIALGGAQRGELLQAAGALEDLGAGSLRVLHERSFLDDPTRLLRLARYGSRLGFAVERHTAELAAAAVAGGALGTVSGARVGAELRLALIEPDAPAALAELERLGVLSALHPRLRFEPTLVRRALELLGCQAIGGSPARPREHAKRVGLEGERTARVGPEGERTVWAGSGGDRADLVLLAAIVLPLALRADGNPRSEIVALLDRLEFPAGDRDRVAGVAVAVPALVDELPGAVSPSELRAVALPVAPEGIALAGALSEPAAAPARRWLRELRYVRLRIGGDDLLAAGIPEGPEIGRRLEAALKLRLDGELSDERDAQLRAALERV
jgi:tRNA nucleotidyltransferase (CCA-adding enzyme)